MAAASRSAILSKLTAQDVEYNYHRILGLGSGYTEKAAVGSGIVTLPIESVTATDKWTVVIKLSQVNANALKGLLLNDCHTVMYPPEIIEEHGDAKDWRRRYRRLARRQRRRGGHQGSATRCAIC